MKIAMVTPVYPPHMGGIEIFTESLSRGLQERGDVVTVYHPANMDVERNNLPVIKHILNFFRAVSFLKTIPCGNVDIIHVQQTEPSLWYPFLLKRMYPDIPVIVHCHTLMITDSGKEYCKLHFTLKGIARYLFMVLPAEFLEKKSIRSADHVIAVTPEVADICRSIRNSQVSLVLNGIHIEDFPLRTNIETHKPFRIFCPGRLIAEKGWIYLVEALPKILSEIDAEVIFSGSDAEGYKSVMMKCSGELGVSDRIQYLDGADFPALIKCQSECDLVVIPWVAEMFGLSVFENLAMGNIIVCTDVGGISRFVRDRDAVLLVEPANPDQLASAVVEGLKNISLRDHIHRTAPERAKEYDIRRTVDQIRKLHREIGLGIRQNNGFNE
ncbi:glycosyltransferase family 4 protein [Methanoregula sp. UBA64]|jgi:glycosyltransferase involved in cell wall biosynthesis|uniref:glycosyltransferase family 4 protein n=1 Tax=Methanoregula sp. UBA64 TaxID=1915554 RepID=UPI0025EE2A27|nr:glycosyltransferase family 4 protein [Methanoregula sp. UBA64]